MASGYSRSGVFREQSTGTTVVKLPLQRRFRHLFSLEIRNFSLINTQLSSHVLVHFTLQPSSTAPVIYASERLPVSVDLCWGGFNIKAILSSKKQSISFEQQVLASRYLCVKVWKYDQISQNTALLVEYNIDMVDLIPFNAAAYVTHGLRYAPNTLVVNLVHGSFAFILPSSPSTSQTSMENSDAAVNDQQSPTVEVASEPSSLPLSNLLCIREPKKSYTLSSVIRMCTVAKALRQSAELALNRQADIDKKFSERATAVAAEQAREGLRSEVELMIKRKQKLELACQLKRAKLAQLQKKTSRLQEELDKTHEDVEDLVSWKENMENNFRTFLDTLKSKRKLVHWRRGQMIADLYEIYSIKRHDGLCFIANVPLPDAVVLPKSGANPSGAVSVSASNAATGTNGGGVVSVPFSTLSVAIGYAAHYLLFIHWLFGVQPRYKIVFRGSHSAIFDHIHTQLATDAERTFPLYFPDRASYQRYRYGIFLLARVCSQLRYCLTQRKQSSSGAQILENISWSVHDLFMASNRVPRPLISTVSAQQQQQHQQGVSLHVPIFSMGSFIPPNALAGSAPLHLGNPLARLKSYPTALSELAAESRSSLDPLPSASEHSNSPMSSIWIANRGGNTGDVSHSSPYSNVPSSPLETAVIDAAVPAVGADGLKVTNDADNAEYFPSSK